MKRKELVHFTLHGTGQATDLSSALMGVAMFLPVIDFVAVRGLSACGGWEIFSGLVLPLLLCGAWLVLVRLFHWADARAFGILGAAVCVLLALQLFSCGDGFRIVGGLIWYLLTGALLVLAVFGYFSIRPLLFATVFLPALLRLWMLIGACSGWNGFLRSLPDISAVCMLFALSCLPVMLKPEQK